MPEQSDLQSTMILLPQNINRISDLIRTVYPINISQTRIEPAAEKSPSYATVLASEFVFVMVIFNTIDMSSITDQS